MTSMFTAEGVGVEGCADSLNTDPDKSAKSPEISFKAVVECAWEEVENKAKKTVEVNFICADPAGRPEKSAVEHNVGLTDMEKPPEVSKEPTVGSLEEEECVLCERSIEEESVTPDTSIILELKSIKIEEVEAKCAVRVSPVKSCESTDGADRPCS